MDISLLELYLNLYLHPTSPGCMTCTAGARLQHGLARQQVQRAAGHQGRAAARAGAPGGRQLAQAQPAVAARPGRHADAHRIGAGRAARPARQGEARRVARTARPERGREWRAPSWYTATYRSCACRRDA